jgi:predicted anti-sigma-YlaC factor YlaD
MRASPSSCRRFPSRLVGLGLCALIICANVGCSVQKIAVNSMADALAGTGDVFASDDDPQLIRDAAPFSLKLMESVLAEAPQHRGLLTTTAASFTQYAYAFIMQDADELESKDIAAANVLRDRARKLLLRARNYGLRGLDAAHSGFSSQLHQNLAGAIKQLKKDDVPLLYWTATSWAAAITISKTDPDLVADQTVVEAMIDRALELDESYQYGAIHSLLISYEPSRLGAATTPEVRARKHFERAVELSGGMQAAPYLALAEAVCVQKQDKKEFESLLNKALAIDVDKKPQWRLANLIMQRRAKWLLSRENELFIE